MVPLFRITFGKLPENIHIAPETEVVVIFSTPVFSSLANHLVPPITTGCMNPAILSVPLFVKEQLVEVAEVLVSHMLIACNEAPEVLKPA